MSGYVVRRWGGEKGERESRVRESRVSGKVLRIGRGTDADVRFEDASVALEHARVERRRDGWVLVDRGSVTGTYLDGRPVQEERLADGAVIDVGEHRLRVRVEGATELEGEAGPLVVEVDPPGETARAAAQVEVDAGVPGARGAATPAGPAVTAPEMDYLRAYGLGRGRLSKGVVAVAAFLLAALAVAWVVAAGRSTDFRPGELSAAHAGTIAAADCAACHTPWRGTLDANCTGCHAPERIAHQAVLAGDGAGSGGGSVAPPACTDCHHEHQGRERISVVADRDCAACHGDLGAVVARAGAAAAVEDLRFARSVTSFADHPEFAVDVVRQRDSVRGGTVERVPVDRATDPTALKLNHALHLKPGLLGPEGRETLVCGDCHELEAAEQAAGEGAGGRDLLPISYERHCQRCHLLNFDAAEEPAPHVPPEQLGNHILGVYRGDRQAGESSVVQRRRRSLRGRGVLSRQERRELEARARRAEYDLYRNACVVCHTVDLEATPLPVVTPPRVPTDWLPYGHFTHGPHLQFTGEECADCHPGAAESTRTEDLLLPSVEGCRPCHGGGAELAEGAEPARAGAPSRCIDCHAYHSGAP